MSAAVGKSSGHGVSGRGQSRSRCRRRGARPRPPGRHRLKGTPMAPSLFIWVALVAGLGLCGGPARADFQKAASAFEVGNFDEAADELSQEAAAGDPRAQAFLGYLLTARTDKLDLRRASDLLRSAAEAGEPEAEFDLAVLYMKGVRSGEEVLLE